MYELFLSSFLIWPFSFFFFPPLLFFLHMENILFSGSLYFQLGPKFMKENGLKHVIFSTADGALEAAPAVSNRLLTNGTLYILAFFSFLAAIVTLYVILPFVIIVFSVSSSEDMWIYYA